MPTYFDEQGKPVRVVMPEAPQDDEDEPSDYAEVIGNYTDWLIEGCRVDEIGRRVLLLAYLMKRPNAGSTQRQLAARMGLSLGKVNKLLRWFKSDCIKNPPSR